MVQGIFDFVWQCKTVKSIGGLDIMKKATIIIIIIIAVVAISIGLYTILPLFTNTVVDEPLPTASGMSIATLLRETSSHY